MESPTHQGNGADENLVRDLYLFFELVCHRRGADWVPDQAIDIGVGPELWADRFSEHFGRVAQAMGWGSFGGNVLCPTCLAREKAI